MRLAAAALLTGAGAVVAAIYPGTVLLAVGICVATAALLSWSAWSNPRIVALRHAALGAGVMALVALITATLLLYGDMPLDTRNWLRAVCLTAVTLPAVYWLILLGTGGFDDAA